VINFPGVDGGPIRPPVPKARPGHLNTRAFIQNSINASTTGVFVNRLTVRKKKKKRPQFATRPKARSQAPGAQAFGANIPAGSEMVTAAGGRFACESQSWGVARPHPGGSFRRMVAKHGYLGRALKQTRHGSCKNLFLYTRTRRRVTPARSLPIRWRPAALPAAASRPCVLRFTVHTELL